MRICFSRVAAALAAGVVAVSGALASADTIADWSFTTPSGQSLANNTQAATGGLQAATAVATQIGMTNSYTYNGGETSPTVASCDIVSTTGTAVSSFSEDTWRIRGTTNSSGKPGNGWNTAAPQYTQGIQLNASTVGEQNIQLSFDWYSTTQGVGDMQVQYTSDGSTWVNVPGAYYVATSNDYYGATAGPPAIANVPVSLDLSSIPAVNNDPNFGIRIVSAYDTDPNFVAEFGATTYDSAASTSATPVLYNNSSGNWRFDNMDITGSAVAVPEPSTFVLLLGVVGLAYSVRRRKAK